MKIEDNPRSGRPTSETTDQNTDLARKIIEKTLILFMMILKKKLSSLVIQYKILSMIT